MKKVFLKTKTGTYPIDPVIAEKYGLRPGMASPFTQGAIVDENGQVPAEEDVKAQNLEGSQGELINDEIAEIDNSLSLSQSEIIDFSQGVDSNPNG